MPSEAFRLNCTDRNLRLLRDVLKLCDCSDWICIYKSHLNAWMLFFLRNLKHRDSSSHYNILVNCITLKYFCTETKNLVEWFYIADSCQNLDFKLRSKSSWQNRAVTECTDNSSKTRMSKESYFIALHWQELGFIQWIKLLSVPFLFCAPGILHPS